MTEWKVFPLSRVFNHTNSEARGVSHFFLRVVLLEGLEIETVAKRVNAQPETIRRHYYKASEWEEFEEQRKDKTLRPDIDKENLF